MRPPLSHTSQLEVRRWAAEIAATCRFPGITSEPAMPLSEFSHIASEHLRCAVNTTVPGSTSTLPPKAASSVIEENGAGDGIRTRDINLGRTAIYWQKELTR